MTLFVVLCIEPLWKKSSMEEQILSLNSIPLLTREAKILKVASLASVAISLNTLSYHYSN